MSRSDHISTVVISMVTHDQDRSLLDHDEYVRFAVVGVVINLIANAAKLTTSAVNVIAFTIVFLVEST